MEKLKLDVDAVSVESFDPRTAPPAALEDILRPSRLDACPSSRGCTEITSC
ncbi:MAG TPA: hypothetical protein VF092_16670 [Longimicrobium sp.]